ncbi:MAG: DUF2306 domain-containing protein [Pseudomonadota bacterium]
MSLAEDIAAVDRPTPVRIVRMLLLAGAAVLLTLVLMALSSLTGGYAVGTDRVAAEADMVQRAADRLTLPIIIHLVTVIPALPLGIYVLVRQKGDALHRLLGRVWAGLMFITALTSLFIGRPGTGFGGSGYSFIHIFSIIVLVSVPMAIWRIRKRDIRGHRGAMEGVFIGLVLAGLFAFLPNRILGLLVFG